MHASPGPAPACTFERWARDDRGAIRRDLVAILAATLLVIVGMSAIAEHLYRLYLAVFGF